MGSSSFDIFFFQYGVFGTCMGSLKSCLFLSLFPPSFYLSRQWTGKKVMFVIFSLSLSILLLHLGKEFWDLALPLSVSICVRTDILSCMGRCLLFAGFRRQVFLSVWYVSRLGLGLVIQYIRWFVLPCFYSLYSLGFSVLYCTGFFRS